MGVFLLHRHLIKTSILRMSVLVLLGRGASMRKRHDDVKDPMGDVVFEVSIARGAPFFVLR